MAGGKCRQSATLKPKRLTVAETYERIETLCRQIDELGNQLNGRLNKLATKDQAGKMIGMVGDLQRSLEALLSAHSEDPPDPLGAPEPDEHPPSPPPPSVSGELEQGKGIAMDPRTQHTIIGMAAIWAIIVTIFSCLMMAGAPWFRPGFYYSAGCFGVDQVVIIDSGVAISVVKCIGAMILLATTYRISQMALTRYRPVGPDIHPGMARLDLFTSFLPFVSNVLVFALTRLFVSYDPWWIWLQSVYFLIIVVASLEDVLPTIRYWRANHRHI